MRFLRNFLSPNFSLKAGLRPEDPCVFVYSFTNYFCSNPEKYLYLLFHTPGCRRLLRQGQSRVNFVSGSLWGRPQERGRVAACVAARECSQAFGDQVPERGGPRRSKPGRNAAGTGLSAPSPGAASPGRALGTRQLPAGFLRAPAGAFPTCQLQEEEILPAQSLQLGGCVKWIFKSKLKGW